MASKKSADTTGSETTPFGAGLDAGAALDSDRSAAGEEKPKSGPRRRRRRTSSPRGKPEEKGSAPDQAAATAEPAPAPADRAPAADAPEAQTGEVGGGDGQQVRKKGRRRRWQDRRRRKRKDRRPGGGQGQAQAQGERQGQGDRQAPATREAQEVEGMLFIEKANHGHIRLRANDYLPTKQDVHVSPRLVQRHGLREGALLKGRYRRGQGRHKWDLIDVESVDGREPNELRNVTPFKNLTSIDPDFHYQVGDGSGEVSLKVIDLLCPVGRGQRGLIVAPPRSGKTVLLKQFACAIEKIYPEVHLVVLLADERPEEATDWKRTIERGDVFVSTNDEMAKRHVELVETVWRRCRRMVELGEDVVLLVDSITRIGRAYNNVKGDSGRTMSGGLDTRALERPKQFFGAARNTETAGSLTILATVLIETGSRMDQVIFEEFKGTGNMELVLSRKLADRRIFPSMDIEKTGTRKEEKLLSSNRLRQVNTLRRVLTRMHWAEAMELLITKLDEVDKIGDFLDRFDVDPEE